jgi:hypothetical protein
MSVMVLGCHEFYECHVRKFHGKFFGLDGLDWFVGFNYIFVLLLFLFLFFAGIQRTRGFCGQVLSDNMKKDGC